MSKPHAYLFADGSCGSQQNNLGGWASIAVTQSERKVLYGVACPTTISRCELIPIIEGLRWIKQNWVHGPGFRVLAISDSEYTVKTLSGLYARHKNTDLWAGLDEVVKGMNVRFRWRERNTLLYMELCDGLCGGFRKEVKLIANDLFGDYRDAEQQIPYGALPDDIEENET